MGLNFYNATAVKMVDGKPSAVTVQTAATVMENVLTWALAMSATERAGVDLTLTCERISKQSKGAASSAEVQLPAIGLVDNNHSTKPTRRKSCPRKRQTRVYSAQVKHGGIAAFNDESLDNIAWDNRAVRED